MTGSSNLPKGMQNLNQDWLYSLWNPKHNEIVRSLFKKYEEFQDDENRAFSSVWGLLNVGLWGATQVMYPWPEQGIQSWPGWLWGLESLAWLTQVSYTPAIMHCHAWCPAAAAVFLWRWNFLSWGTPEFISNNPVLWPPPTSPIIIFLWEKRISVFPKKLGIWKPLNTSDDLYKKLLPLHYRGFKIAFP